MCDSDSTLWWCLDDSERPIGRVRRDPQPNATLDVVDCAGSADIRRICELLASVEGIWPRQLIDTLTATELVGWCGYDGSDQEGSTVTTQVRWLNSLAKLEEWRVVSKHRDASAAHLHRIFNLYFEVPKANPLLLRAILDCRPVNIRCDKPPGVRFPSVADMFACLFFFPRFCVVCQDFRHYFYQLTLPPATRRLFSIICGGDIFSLQVWPMGFSWTPWVGQCISSLAVIRAAILAGYTVDGNAADTAPPPVLVIRNIAGTVVALGLDWYDNVILISGNVPVRDRLKAKLAIVCQELKLVVKAPGATVSVGSAEFLGIRVIRRSREGIHWAHAVDKAAQWRLIVSQPWPNARDIAEVIGTLTWHWQLSGTPLSTIFDVIEVSRNLSRKMAKASRRAWDSPHGLEPQTLLTLRQKLSVIAAEDAEFIRLEPVERDDLDSQIFAASDAMNYVAAGVLLSENGPATVTFEHRFAEDDVNEHINVKETWAAIFTVEEILCRTEQTHIVLGVDNTMAKFALSHFYFPECAELALRLLHLAEELHRRGSILTVVHVPGKLNVADEPSRGLAIDQDKAKTTLQFLHARLGEERWRKRTVPAADP